MKSNFKARAFVFLCVVGALLSIGIIGVSRSKKINEDKMAETMVSSRLRAMAFECSALLREGNVIGDGHAIDQEEANKIQLIIGKLEELQKALVNGNEVYMIPDSKSPELTAQILKTSPPILAVYDQISQMIHADKIWNVEKTTESISKLNLYAEEMSRVTGVVLSESDGANKVSDIALILLIVGGIVLLVGAYFVLLAPLLKRTAVSEFLISDSRKEIEIMKRRWSESLMGLYHQFQLPAFAFQNVLTKFESTTNEQVDEKMKRQFESSVEFLNEVVEEMRMMAEIESQSFQSTRSIIDLNEFLRSTTQEVSSVFGIDKCSIQIEVDNGIPLGLVQDQQLLHHCLIQVLCNHLILLNRTNITMRVELLNQDAGLVQIKFLFLSQAVSRSESSGNTVILDEVYSLEMTQKFVEKLGGKLSQELGQTFFTVVFETRDAIELNDVSRLKGLKAALFVSDIENQLLLKKQLASWGVYAVPFSRIGQQDELESVLSKFNFCIADEAFLSSQGNDVINALNRRVEQHPLLFFVLCKEVDRATLKHSFIRGFLTDPLSIEELLHLLLNFSDVFLKQNVRSISSDFKPKDKLSFLVAHSDDLMRGGAQRNIQVMGYDCRVASTTKDTIAALNERQFDVLLAESSFFINHNNALNERLKMLASRGGQMVVIEIKTGESIDAKLSENNLVDQTISNRLGIKEVQSVISEWFEV